MQKTVSYYTVGGMAGGWYTTGTYGWEKEQLVELRREEQTSTEAEPEVFVRTVYVRTVPGPLQLASQVQLSREGENGEKHCLLAGEWTEFDKQPKLLFTESPEKVVRQDGRGGKCQ